MDCESCEKRFVSAHMAIFVDRSLVCCLAFVTLCPLLEAGEWRVVSSVAAEIESAPGVSFTTKTLHSDRDVHLRAVSFSTKKYTIKIVDQPGDRQKLDTAMSNAGCVAGVNGGYFHPDFKPSGLVLTAGEVVHPFQKAKLLSGVLAVNKGRLVLQRAAEFKLTPAVSEAIQAGPFLLDAGKVVPGLESKRVARRTIIATDGKENAALVVISDLATLSEAAELVATPGLLDFPVQRALNLDGGSSTGLWVKTSPPFYLREFGSVRNFVGLIALEP